MAKKLKEPVSHVRGWINRKIEIAFIQSYLCILRGTLLTSLLQDCDPDRESGSGLGLAQ